MKIFLSKHAVLQLDLWYVGPENILFCRRVYALFSPEIYGKGHWRGYPRSFHCCCYTTHYYYYYKEQEEKEERSCKFVISAPNTTILVFPMKTLLDPETKLSKYRQGRRQYLHRNTESFVWTSAFLFVRIWTLSILSASMHHLSMCYTEHFDYTQWEHTVCIQ